jgi:hypothetical protein
MKLLLPWKPQIPFLFLLFTGIFDAEISNIRKSPQLDDVRALPKPVLRNSTPAVDQQPDTIKKVRYCICGSFHVIESQLRQKELLCVVV